MDKKNSYSRQSFKALTSENRKSADSKKNLWPRNAHRRENPNYTNSKFDAQRYSKPGPSKSRPNYDKRPKPRGGNDSNGPPSNNKSTIISSITSTGTTRLAEDELSSDETDQLFNYETELNSVYLQGSKKQNLNHLLNFHCAPREDETSISGHCITVRNGNGKNRKNLKKHRYNKEQFLQANFQFVINSNAEPFITSSSPDTLIDWSLIEQINIQTTEEPQCPICLYPPIAAKLTRCGHAYCWPCILHYLALTDKSWRKCPICYEAIHLNDLKSTIIVQQKNFIVGDIIKLQLMRREKGSIFIEKIDNKEIVDKRIPHLSKNIESGRFSKFLLATDDEILSIVKREQDELLAIFNENYPEFIFVQQALDLLEQRKLGICEKVIIDPGNKQNVDEDENNEQNDEEISELQLENGEEKTVASNKENSEYECTVFNYETQLQSVEQIEKDANDECSTDYLDIQLDNTIENNFVSKYKTNVASTLTKGNCNIKEGSKFYYFYQSVDGQNIFLHSLNVKMLQTMYGSLNQAPIIIEAKILQKEVLSMNEDLRKKITCLGHLPLTCQFEIVEIQLQPPIISELILEIFKEDILLRKKNRLRREREERKREKEINEINERQMGKLIARSANIDIKSQSQFPTCGDEPFPSILTDYKLNSQPKTFASPQRLQFKNTSFANILTETPTKEELWPSLDGLSPTPLPTENKQTTIWGTPMLSHHHTIERTERFSESDNGASVSVENDLNFGAKQKLGDVIADALLQTKLDDRNHGNVINVGNNKKKKNKKMLVFSTGMSFNGN